MVAPLRGNHLYPIIIMKKLLIIVLLFFSITSMAIEIDKRTMSALEYISQGYIQYGYDELKKAANTNSIAAQFYIAVCYEHGISAEKDMNQAFKMYRRAAERGLPDAMYHLSLFYKDGIVVSQDSSREQDWVQRYNQKGGKMLLPDFLSIYNEGLKHQENYAITPKSNDNKPNLTAQNKGNNSQNRANNNTPQIQRKPIQNEETQPSNKPATSFKKSDVDLNIPVGQDRQESTFALIIANENYQDVAKVSNALNDGKVFAAYCEKTLGIPQNNIKLITDATLNNIKRQLNWLTQVMDAYQGEANIIIYYAGHGIPNESNGAAYLLPVDGFVADISTGYSLDNLYAELNSKPAKSVLVFLDACFSGAQRGEGMLASARGVAIKAKRSAPKGNMVVLSAAQGDETAYPYKDKGHGLFTYYLLKKLQTTQGNVSLGELAGYITTEVKKQSIVSNGKSQTPSIIASPLIGDKWKSWKLK